MDVFGTVVTAVTQIYNITVFVRGVVSEMKTYDAKSQVIQAKLEHEFLFLEDFKNIMFEREDAAFSYNALTDVHKRDFQNILGALDRTLSQYGLLATKHGLNLISTQDTVKTSSETIQIQEIRHQSSKWRTKFQHFRATFTKLDWSLFDKDKILKLLQECSEWTERLRQVMFMVLLVNGTIGATSRSNLVNSASGKNLRLHVIAERQMRTETVIDVEPLEVNLLSVDQESANQDLYQLAEYEDTAGFGSVSVLLERHKLNGNLAASYSDDDEATQKKRILEPIHSLVSLLRGTTSQDDGGDLDPLRTLECMGYIDRGYPDHVLMAYRSPSQESLPKIKSLHDWISEFDMVPTTKPPIGDRFFVAYSLASSIFGVLVSGWVHKGLRSRAVLLLNASNKARLTPHLIGWGTTRRTGPANGSSRFNEPEANDLEANIYRHPDRYDLPREGYTPAHDIYSLGVVLLEIGCWKTMSARFKKPISVAIAKEMLPPIAVVKEHLLKVARSTELKQEMGNEYARAAERCLLTDFDVGINDERYTTLIRNFKELVIDKLRIGLSL